MGCFIASLKTRTSPRRTGANMHYCGPVLVRAVLASLLKPKSLQQVVFVCCFQSSDSGRCPHWGNPAYGHLQSLSASNFSSFSCSSLPCAELRIPQARLETPQTRRCSKAPNCRGCKMLARPGCWLGTGRPRGSTLPVHG